MNVVMEQVLQIVRLACDEPDPAPITAREITRVAGLTQSSVGGALGALKERGLVEPVPVTDFHSAKPRRGWAVPANSEKTRCNWSGATATVADGTSTKEAHDER